MTDIAGFSTLEYLAHINASFSNEKLCEWTQNQRIEYKTLLDALEQSNGTNSCATKEEKGRSLEEIASFLLNNCGHIFDVDRNIRTCTNEIDKFLVLAADEIRRHLEDYAEHELNSNFWQGLLDALETEQRERAHRQARKIRTCPTCGKPLEVMSITDNGHSPGGFDVIAHCQNCHSGYEWFCDKDGGVSDMKQYFFG